VTGEITNYYDWERGWDETNPGWYEVALNFHDIDESEDIHVQAVEWIQRNIQGYKKHCRWRFAGNYLKYKFRYERDYVWFKLTWG
jgi:hypothetical protein